MNFEKTLLDAPIKPKSTVRDNKFYLVPLQKPLKPTPYVPLKPKPKQRRLRIVAPVALPRNRLPMKVDKKVKKLIDEIRPYYTPEAISQFKKDLKFIQKAEITQKKKALKNNALSFDVTIVNNNDPSIQLADTRGNLKEKLKTLIGEKKKGFKFYVTLKVKMRKETEDGTIYAEPYFSSSTMTVTNKDQILEKIVLAEEVILTRIAEWLSEGSGWVVEEILNHYINVASYIPLRGNSYIPLPEELRNSKKGLINLKNEDNKCFLWCHIRHKNPAKKDPQRVKISDKEFVQKLDYSGITFPVQIKDVGKIEKQNSINISIFGYENEKLYPIRISEEKYDDHMDLLYITEGNEKTKSHFVLIQNFDKLMYNFTKHKDTKHFCKRCLHCFSSKNLLERHQPDCFALNGTQAIEMPVEGSKIYFKNHHKMQPVPFVIYADFEAITEKIDTCQPPDSKSYTTTYQSHRACSFGYKVVCHADQCYSKPVEIYRGEDAIEKFIVKMFEEVRSCQSVMREHFNKSLIMTEENERDFKNSITCYICGRRYKMDEKYAEEINGKKPVNGPVRDHCHITGKYRGSAHNFCNLKLRLNPEYIKIPVIFHNLKGYDSHFIMQKIGKMIEDEVVYDIYHQKNDKGNIIECKLTPSIKIIANNFEKYMSFSIGKHLRFIDSFQFMSQSLDKLSSNLLEDRFIYTERETDGDLTLLKKKGVYPYDYMDSFSRFNETELPKRKDFYSILNDTYISEDEYQHAQEVWDAFKIRNLGEYHDLYLKTDILLLVDVFENFRKTCLHHYRLDPSHYMSSPGLSWDAMLKMTKINLDLISDIDMQLFIEKGLRGGISYISHRHGKANNKYMRDFNPEEENSYLMYLDANNLYGWAMSQSLPFGDFKWLEFDFLGKDLPGLDEKGLKKLGIKLKAKEKDYELFPHTAWCKEIPEKGIILEVDLEYPEELHDLHNDYPCAPEKIVVTDDMLSDYCRNIKGLHGNSSGNVKKLVPTLLKKTNYVLHYRNLKLYLNLGLKLTKVHRVLEFSQSTWLKSYIDFNTEMRKDAKNSFEKDFFKLMNNSVFGKTMENLRKRTNIELVTDEERLLKLTAKPTYVSSKIFNENLVGIHTKKERLLLDKPSYVGMCILDLSKTDMYDFHYNYIKKKYPDSQLLFTDTDSLFYHIKTERDVYEDFWLDKNLFDNSDYPKSSKFFFGENKKVIGKFKDEAAGKPILEFVGLKSKMYSYIKEDYEKVQLQITKKDDRLKFQMVEAKDNEKFIKKYVDINNKTAKGVKKNVIKKEIRHSNYIDVLFNKEKMHHQMKSIRSEHHQISSYHLNKVSLSPFDDKRYILSDGITSYAYGNKNIEKNNRITYI